MSTFSIGVDIGGTFTDCGVVDEQGRIVGGKVPTTPADRSIGFFGAVEEAGRKLGLSLPDLLRQCVRLVHGTTTGTNAIVTRSGARVGLVTTAGHRDAMFIMKGSGRTAGVAADQLMDLIASREKPVPIVPKRDIVEIPERIDVDGDVVVALDRELARDRIGALLAQGVEAIAISLLWSIKNPAHEQMLADVVKELAPEMFVSCASDLTGRLGEYERTATAVMNAYIGPLMTRYVESIETRARDLGYPGTVLFSQCAGGAITGAEAKRSPILTVNSGPVAGVMGSALFARDVINEPNVLTTDMGGTTFDVSLIRDYEAMVKDSAILEKYELALPMLDVESIGAGGGSIAWIDASGRLNVGPKSAGAVPGPACYGQGGTEPTVTDADVVLGIIDPASFLHGDFAIDVAAAERAVGDLGKRLGLDVYQTAAGINRIIDSKMAGLLRRMSEFRGLDPRQFAMLAFGGGGPVHAAACAQEAGVARVVVPLPDIAPVWSAAGAANADIVHVYLESRLLNLPVTRDQLEQFFTPLVDRARAALEQEGFADDDVHIARSLQMKYAQQVYSIDVPIDLAGGEQGVAHLAELFTRRYEERYGKNAGFAEGGIQITAFHVRGVGRTTKASLRRTASTADEAATELSRPVYWAELGAFADTPVLRTSGAWGAEDRQLTGPYLVELPDTVVVIRPGQTAVCDSTGSIVIHTAR